MNQPRRGEMIIAKSAKSLFEPRRGDIIKVLQTPGNNVTPSGFLLNYKLLVYL